ncbi:C4-dicarboxylate TRAP transporter substrate-binding protein [Pseudochelatococcus sp. B33]
MHKVLRALAAAVALSMVTSSAIAQTVNLRVAHALAPTEPIHQAVVGFAEAVNARSEGRLNITVFPSEQLGINREVYEQVRQGAPIIQVADPGFMSDYIPDFGVMNGPYLLDTPRDFNRILESEWYAGLTEKAAKAGFRPLSFNYFFGKRHMLGSKPFVTPEDLKGVTMRIAPNPIWVETFGALNARGVPLPWGEVYSALSQNVVESVEAPMGSLYGAKLQEQRKTLSLTGHFTAFLGLVMNETIFQSLAPDLQQILIEEAVNAGNVMTEKTLENDEKLLETLKDEGVTVVTDVDTAAFREATAKVYSAFPDWTPGVYDQIRAILDN